MKAGKLKKAEAAGWKAGTVAEFLGLTLEEEMLIEIKLALASQIKAVRKNQSLTQQQLAKKIGSSQSRIAKVESADESVSMDLMVSTLAGLGATRKEIGTVIGTPGGYTAQAPSRRPRKGEIAKAEVKRGRKPVASR